MSLKKVLEVAVVLSAVDKMTAPIRNAVGASVTAMGKLSAQTAKLSQNSMAFGRDAAGMGLGLAASMALPIKAAMDFETGMTNVRKVVDGLKDEKAFAQFSDQVIALGRELPIAYNDITEMVAASGRMGIAKEDLIAYTREVGKMSMAFDMAAGDVGERMGKISNIFGIAAKDIGMVGDAINSLDDASNSKGAEIMDVLQRVGGTANLLGLSAKNTAALAATMVSLGSTSETASTAINALFAKLATASTGKKEFKAALGGLGFDPMAIQNAMATDAQGTILKVMTALGKVDRNKIIGVSNELFGGEYFDDAAKLASGIDTYVKSIKTIEEIDPATGKLKHLGSMQREYEARMKTSAAQAAIFKNNISEIAITLGTSILPAFNEALNAIKPYIEAFRDWAKQNPETVKTIAKVVAATAALSLGIGAASFVFGGLLKLVSLAAAPFKLISLLMDNKLEIVNMLTKSWRALTSVLGLVGKAFMFLGGVIRSVTLFMMANPIIAAIAAIAAAAYLIYEYWEPIKNFFIDLWEGIKNIFWGFVEWVRDLGQTFYDIGVYLMTSMRDGLKSMALSIGETIYGPVAGAVGDIAKKLGFEEEVNTLADAYNTFKNGAPLELTRPDAARSPASPTPINMNNRPPNISELMFSPSVTVNGNATPEQKAEAEGMMTKWSEDFMRKFKEMTRQQDRKAFQ